MENEPMKDKEVTWKVFDVEQYGTITSPTDEEVHPAVVFVAGSGPTDRSWCSPLLPGTNGSGKLLAEALASQGFVTLRYDKLASGPHVRESIPKLVGKISMQSHMEELKGAVETLIAEENVDKDNLFVLTNSEGAIHAVNYQLQAKSNGFKGLVLTGAPGRAVGELGRSQIFDQIKQLPDAQLLMKPYDDAVADFLANKPIVIDSSLPIGIKLLLQSLENPANLPFSRELWIYSLPEYLAKVNEPILVVIGKKDIQVDWKIDGEALENATAQKTAVSFVYPENANHLLKHEEAPREALTAQYVSLHYNAPDAELDGEAANAIFSWLKKQTQR
jgi:alpha-beta hydrolase superfamily lysophospholipase